MNIHCPLCEQEIKAGLHIQNGQHVVCPYCEKKFTYYVNCSQTPEPSEPLIIASGEDFESYLCGVVNEFACAECVQTKASGDQGVDLIVTLNDGRHIAIQCKLYSTPVGNDAVQQVIAGRVFYKCDLAAVVTNNTYTDSATELASSSGVTLLHYSELRQWISGLGGSSRGKMDAFEERSATFFEQHPNYVAELSLHLKYKFGNPYSFSPDEIISDLEELQEGILSDGRCLMRETSRLVYVLIADFVVGMSAGIEHGYFGKPLARVHETYDVLRSPIKTDKIGEECWLGIGKYIALIDRLSAVLPKIKQLIANVGFKNQIFKDELLPEHLSVVAEDYHAYTFKGDMNLYNDIASGRLVVSEIIHVKQSLVSMFDIVRVGDVSTWDTLKLELQKRMGK